MTTFLILLFFFAGIIAFLFALQLGHYGNLLSAPHSGL